ncbi:hypothetical protein ACFQGN_32240 [Streptomyces goshikiensis]|uniref:hypothetical protein n=1 Tax=Streptomyces goshikiensis TaxID=1942 RepID=UPI00361439AA
MSLFHPERLADLRMQRVNCNNTPAILISGERLEGVFLIEIADGKIINLRHPQPGQTSRGGDPAADQPVGAGSKTLVKITSNRL